MASNYEQSGTVGEKIKFYREQKDLTLKELGQKVNLSAGYLSQLERGQTSVTLLSIQNIAKALEVPASVFLELPPPAQSHVIHEYEQKVFTIEHQEDSYYYNLLTTVPGEEHRMVPNIKVLLPSTEEKSMYTNQDEELGYVMEGVLTLCINGVRHELYPGDFFHFLSTIPHYLVNNTNRLVKVFYVTIPLKEEPKEG